MNTVSKIRQGREDRIKERIQKFKERKGYLYFLSHIDYPEKQKASEKHRLYQGIKEFETSLPEIKKIIKRIKKFIPQIWDQNKITALYLLIGKAYMDLEAMLLLAREGHSYEVIELGRSGKESLDLAFLFLEAPDNDKLDKWFKGEIIVNEFARKLFHSVLNANMPSQRNLPVYAAKKDIYDIYSEFTHSSYAAILDLIDVFHEDIDYSKLSGFHYSLKYFDTSILNLAFELLLTLKSIFLNLSDEKTVNEIDILLKSFGKLKATPQEINNTLKEYY